MDLSDYLLESYADGIAALASNRLEVRSPLTVPIPGTGETIDGEATNMLACLTSKDREAAPLAFVEQRLPVFRGL
jgi:hypothetical protein